MARGSKQTSSATEQVISNKGKTLVSYNLKQGIGTSVVGGIVNNGVLTLQDSAGGVINIYGLQNVNTPFATDSEAIAGVLTDKVASVKQIIDNYITRTEYVAGSVHLSSGFIANNDLHLILTDNSEVVVPDINESSQYDHWIQGTMNVPVDNTEAQLDWQNS